MSTQMNRSTIFVPSSSSSSSITLLLFAFALAFIALLPLAHASIGRPPKIIRGVNLGGFLTLEPWIRPSLFQVPLSAGQTQPIDEWTLGEYYGRDRIDDIMTAHYDSFVTRDDLVELAQAGINAVRIPVGYWIIDRAPNEPFVTPSKAWPFLTRTLTWCHELSLDVQIDLHGLPGSQNGLDHSGKKGDIYWQYGVNYTRSLNILYNLTNSLESQGYLTPHGPVTMIQPVNEPWMTIDINFIIQFYYDSYKIIREINKYVNIVYSDSFRLNAPEWTNFMTDKKTYTNVYLDEHFYQIFDVPELQMSNAQRTYALKGYFNYVASPVASTTWLMTGEWTTATDDCAFWLNGVKKGARWDGTYIDSNGNKNPPLGSCTGDHGQDTSKWSYDYKQFLYNWTILQMNLYENSCNCSDSGSAGWFFWNFKIDPASGAAPNWNFLLGIREGWIPNPVNERNKAFVDKSDATMTTMKISSNSILLIFIVGCATLFIALF